MLLVYRWVNPLILPPMIKYSPLPHYIEGFHRKIGKKCVETPRKIDTSVGVYFLGVILFTFTT